MAEPVIKRSDKERVHYGYVCKSFWCARALDADIPRDCARGRQRHLHFNLVEQASWVATRPGQADGTPFRDGDTHPPLAIPYLDHQVDGSAFLHLGAPLLRTRSHANRRWLVPAG